MASIRAALESNRQAELQRQALKDLDLSVIPEPEMDVPSEQKVTHTCTWMGAKNWQPKSLRDDPR